MEGEVIRKKELQVKESRRVESVVVLEYWVQITTVLFWIGVQYDLICILTLSTVLRENITQGLNSEDKVGK